MWWSMTMSLTCEWDCNKMNVLNFKIILKLTLLFLNFQIGYTNKLEMIADIIKSYNKPSQVQAIACSQRGNYIFLNKIKQ